MCSCVEVSVDGVHVGACTQASLHMMLQETNVMRHRSSLELYGYTDAHLHAALIAIHDTLHEQRVTFVVSAIGAHTRCERLR